MRPIQIYLIVYFTLLSGAVVVLWQSGALAVLPAAWMAIALVVSAGLGILLAVISVRPHFATRRHD
jgi:hypothetical protein